MPTQEELSKELIRLNNRLQGIDKRLLIAIDRYQDKYEAELLKQNFDLDKGLLKRTSKNFSKAQALSISEKLKYKNLVEGHIKQYVKVAGYSKDFNIGIGVKSTFDYKNARIIKQLQKIDFDQLFQQGKELDRLIKAQLVNAIALESDMKRTIANLSRDLFGRGEKAGKLSRYSKTYMRTSLFGLSRSIDQELYDEIGVKRYLYAGPIADKKVRSFCRARVGKVFNAKQIEQFSGLNRSGLNGFFSPGGWNCRHRMIPAPGQIKL